MRKNNLLILLLIVIITFTAIAQEKEDDKKTMRKIATQKVYQTDPKDVDSIDGIIKATYDAISGEASKKRDWNRFKSLFHEDARLIPTGTDPNTKATGAKAFTPEEYIKRSEPFMMKNGFFEKEIARRTNLFGNIAQVFSTYEGRYKLSDKKPFLRGINSFQLLNDGKRWWIISIYWQAESSDNPLPDKYLKTTKK